MPSLAQLEEFKSSFKDVGNEAIIMSGSPMPYEDYELPEDDPPSPFPNELESAPFPEAESKLRVSDLGLDLPPESFSEADDSDGGFDFGDLLGGGDLESPPGAELADAESPLMELPDDLLSGFSDELESDGLPIDEAISAPSDDLPAADAPDFADTAADALAEDVAVPAESESLLNTAGTEPPAETAADGGDFSGLEFPDIDLSEALDMGGEPPAPDNSPDNAADSTLDDGLGLDDLPDFDNSGAFAETPAPDNSPDNMAGSTPDDDLSLGDLPDFDDSGAFADPLASDSSPDNMVDSTLDDGLGLGDLPDFDDSGAFTETPAPDSSLDNAAGSTPDDDLGLGDLPDFDDKGAFTETPAPDSSLDNAADSTLDDGLGLGDLPDFDDSGAFAETPPPDSSLDNIADSVPDDDLGLGDLPDFDDSGAFTETPAPDSSLDSAADSTPDDGLGLGDLPDFDDSGAFAETPVPDDGLGDTGGFGGEDFGSVDFGSDASIGFGTDELSVDMGGETLDTDSGAEADSFRDLPDMSAGGETPQEGGDAFDNFTAGDDWGVSGSTLETPDFSESAAADDLGDFSLSGFDDLDENGKPAAAAAPAEFSGDVEEIHLDEEEFRQLQDTLSTYPLNLRVACEELIVEQAVAPEQMSALIKLLVRGAPAKETAALAGKILGKTIPIPKGYAKQTGAELEAEQASLGYIFAKRVLPVLRLAGAILLVVGSLGYLVWRFAVIPLQAESLYKQGHELILTGEYPDANEKFRQGFAKHRVKNWFYRYAEAFRDERQYIYAEQKYDELLRVYPRDKKGALDYAAMETGFIRNYEKADRVIRANILDYAVNDREGLLALAETNLAWGETEPSRYEEARGAYARLMERYGRKDPYLEGMLKYFIRTDNLGEVLPLQAYFMSNPKRRKISVPALAELGGYLIGKRFEEREGVPEEYVDRIEGIRDVLIRAIQEDRTYPESYYHLARYNFRYGLGDEERQNLEDAIRAFSAAREETPQRTAYHIDARRRYGEVLINAKEFFPAEEELIRGVRLYEDARARGLIKTSSPEFGRLYANLGDLEFFVKDGNMDAALRFYEEAERNNWAPPEIQYRMGAAHYQNGDFEEALGRFFTLSSVMPNNRKLLYALGNTAYLRGNYFAAQGYYNRLMDLLDAERVRFPNVTPGGRPEEQDLAERVMVADNNLGVTLESLTRVSGDTSYRSRALYLFSESIRAWDVLTRDPENMTRMRPIRELYSPGINLAYLNTQNILHASPSYEQQIFMRIDRDCLEPSGWEALVPRDYRLSDQLPMNVE